MRDVGFCWIFLWVSRYSWSALLFGVSRSRRKIPTVRSSLRHFTLTTEDILQSAFLFGVLGSRRRIPTVCSIPSTLYSHDGEYPQSALLFDTLRSKQKLPFFGLSIISKVLEISISKAYAPSFLPSSTCSRRPQLSSTEDRIDRTNTIHT